MLLSPLMQSPSLGEEPDIRKEAAPVRDVQLGAEGRLEVAIVDKAGKPVASKLVRVEFKGHAIAYAHTDRDGHIVVRGLRPGVHTVATVGQKTAFRFWDAKTAPPAALRKPAVVIGEEQLLGQYGPPMISPAMMATGVTPTAVAVVLGGKSSGTDHRVLPASP